MSEKTSVTVVYNAETGDYKSDVDSAKQSNKEFEQSVDSSSSSVNEFGGFLSTTTGKFVAFGGAIAGAVVALDNLSGAVATNALNQAELQSNLNLSNSETQELTNSLIETNKAYGITASQTLQINALNSEYVSTADQLVKANQLVVQTATLYALKEGDVTEAGNQLVTSQEALRDVILTGSTTAFEDAGISLEEYGNQLLIASGLTKEQADVIAEGTNGTFEYVEQLSKAVSPQERFNALVATTSLEFEGLVDNLTPAQQQAIEFQQNLTALQNTLKQVSAVLLNVILTIGSYVSSVFQAITTSQAFNNVVSFLKDTINVLIPILQNLGQILFQIGSAVATFLLPIFQNFINIISFLAEIISTALAPILVKLGVIFGELFLAIQPVINALANLWGAIRRFLLPVLQVLINIVTVLADILITVLGPVLTLIANIISTILVVAINALTTVLNVLTPIVQVIANLFTRLANIIQSILAVAFTILQGVVSGINAVFRTLSDLTNKLARFVSDLARAIQQSLINAFELLLKPVQIIIDAFQAFLDLINDIIGAVSNLASSFFDFITPFDILGRGASFNVNNGSGGSGGSSNTTINRTTIFNVQQQGQLSKIDVLRMERGLA